MVYAAVAVAVLALVAVAGIPAGWYGKGKAAAVAQPVAAAPAPEAQASSDNTDTASQPEQLVADPNSAEAAASMSDTNALAAKRAREARERARMAGAAAAKQAAADQPVAGQPGRTDVVKKPEAAKPAPKMVTVQVSYDEAGRVTQTSGGDGTAQRIARQKRFPTGKAGSTTVTIPIN